jgi:hypothetical protein
VSSFQRLWPYLYTNKYRQNKFRMKVYNKIGTYKNKKTTIKHYQDAKFIQMYRRSSWNCSVCKIDVHLYASIVCDGCLEWNHLKCVGLKVTPSFASILRFPNELHVLITYTVSTFQRLWPYLYTNKYRQIKCATKIHVLAMQTVLYNKGK